MSLIDRVVNRLLDGRISSMVDRRFQQEISLKSNRANEAITQFLSGYPAPNRNIPSLDEALYATVAWVYTGISRIADSLIEVPLEARAYKKDDDFDVITKGPEFQVFNPPNPDMAREEFIAKSVCDMMLVGGAFWTIVPGVIDAWEVYHMLFKHMHPIVGNSKDVIAHYEYKEAGTLVKYEREEVVHIRLPNPNDHFHGQSAIQPTRSAIQLYEAVQSLYSDFFRNAPFFGMAFLTSGPLGEVGTKQLKEDIKGKYTRDKDGQGEGRFDPFIGSNITPVSLSQGLNSLPYDSVSERSVMSILAAIGTPPAIVGILKYANYANMDAQIKIFWRYKLVPLLRYIEAAINLRVPALFGNPNLRWEFNTKSIDALQDDKGEVATRTSTVFAGGISTLDEARVAVGLPPSEDPELGVMYNWQLPKPAMGGLFGDPFDYDEDQNDEEGSSPEDLRTPVGAVSHRAGTAHRDKGDPFLRNSRCLKSVAFIKRRTNPFAKVMRGFFRDELERVIEKYNALTNDATLLTPLRPFTKDVPDNAEELFNRALEAELLRQISDPYIRQTVYDIAKRAFSSLGLDEAFDVTNPRVVHFIENGINKMARDITASTWKDIQGVLSEGYSSGASSAAIRDNLTELFEGWYQPGPGQVGIGDRCMRIARTEMGKFVHGGQYQAYQEAVDGYGLNLVKRWLHSHKAIFRPEHMALDNTTVPFKEYFNVGGEMALYPNDPNLSAAQTINCGCDFIVEEIE